jgi:hypothetical protein
MFFKDIYPGKLRKNYSMGEEKNKRNKATGRTNEAWLLDKTHSFLFHS